MGNWSNAEKERHRQSLRDVAIRKQCPGCDGKNGLCPSEPNGLCCRYCSRQYTGRDLPCTLDREIIIPPVVVPVIVLEPNRLMPGWTEPALAARYQESLARLMALRVAANLERLVLSQPKIESSPPVAEPVSEEPVAMTVRRWTPSAFLTRNASEEAPAEAAHDESSGTASEHVPLRDESQEEISEHVPLRDEGKSEHVPLRDESQEEISEHVPVSICDDCSTAMPLSDAQTCHKCGGTFCGEHIGEYEHDCEENTA